MIKRYNNDEEHLDAEITINDSISPIVKDGGKIFID